MAVGSGKLMDEDWLRDGQFQHLAYSIHLLAWLLIAIAVTLHLLAVLQRGGLPLARSIASPSLRPGDCLATGLPRSSAPSAAGVERQRWQKPGPS